MTTPQNKVDVETPAIVIKRGSLGTIRVGPTDIEIPAEDVTIPLNMTRLDIENIASKIVTAEIAKLKEQIAAAARPTELLPGPLFKAPEVLTTSESAKET